jgi:hydroxylamine dehydrogenase
MMPKSRVLTPLLLVVALSFVACPPPPGAEKETTPKAAAKKAAVKKTGVLSAADKACVDCHKDETPGIVAHWEDSAHSKVAKAVGCFSCHQAKKGEVDAFEHEDQIIATIVSPKDCSRCHKKESDEYQASHHATAGNILASLDNLLGEVIEGPPAAVNGCKQCHGSTVKVLANGKLDPTTWPNTGIGRINPDGSKGSCSACHSRHEFSSARARRPENCGKCHMGPDHPQIEIYNESKHGIAFYASQDKMNLTSKKWRVGIDYSAAPTCATCHMSATESLGVTHDVGARISWTLRPVISKKLPNWEKKRADMQKVCGTCHADQWVGNFYKQFDSAVELYNSKFAKPAKEIMVELKKAGLITPTPFDDKIEWTFFELWHHEGRRARHGAAMMGPDYTQWHGFYEVAKHFYIKFLPQVAELGRKDLVDKVLSDPQHAWKKGLTKEMREKINKFYNDRYGHKP